MIDRLAPRDRQVLEVRAIAPAIRDERGYRTVTAHEAASYGFGGDQARDGLLVPCHNTQGVNGAYQLRPHNPRLNEHGKPIKYEWPAGNPLTIDVPLAAQPLLDDVTVPLLITESPIKADAIMSAAEPGTVAAIAVVGVWGWRSGGAPLSDFRDIPLCTKQGRRITARRHVRILFDSDTATNPKVAYARQDLTEFLERRGGSIKHVDIPTDTFDQKQGIDDALANGYTLDGLLATAHTPRPVDSALVADDPDKQRIAELEAKVASLEDELRTERADRADDRRILGDNRRPAQERINAVLWHWNMNRVAKHGDGLMGRGGTLAPVVAVDETGGILAQIKGLAAEFGTSPKYLGENIAKWQAEGHFDHSVTRVPTGKTVMTRDGEEKPVFESTARIRPRGNLGDFLHDLYMAAPPARVKAKPKPKNRCLDHPDDDLIRRITTECSVCHKPVAPERASWVPAGTPPEITEHTATIAFDGQNTPEVTSENAPQVISEHDSCTLPSSPPTLTITAPGVISGIARAQDALHDLDHAPPDDHDARTALTEALDGIARVRNRTPDPKRTLFDDRVARAEFYRE